MSNRKNDGDRFMVSPNGKEAHWIHPLEIAARAPGWYDCTDMGDAEFELFMDDLHVKFPPIAA